MSDDPNETTPTTETPEVPAAPAAPAAPDDDYTEAEREHIALMRHNNVTPQEVFARASRDSRVEKEAAQAGAGQAKPNEGNDAGEDKEEVMTRGQTEALIERATKAARQEAHTQARQTAEVVTSSNEMRRVINARLGQTAAVAASPAKLAELSSKVQDALFTDPKARSVNSVELDVLINKTCDATVAGELAFAKAMTAASKTEEADQRMADAAAAPETGGGRSAGAGDGAPPRTQLQAGTGSGLFESDEPEQSPQQLGEELEATLLTEFARS